MVNSETDTDTDDSTDPLRDSDVFGAYIGQECDLDDTVPVEQFTHVYYAFADVEDGVIDEPGDRIDDLVALRERNPDLNVIVSVGGWGRCEEFPEMAATTQNRQRFAESAIKYIREHDLDGIDYDWEFPDEDETEEFTAMLRTLRKVLDEAGAEDDRRYLLTSALSNLPSHLEGVNLGAVHEYLDLVNTMTYDMQVNERSHHTNLYTSPLNPRFSVQDTVETYLDAGVPCEKIVIGSGFYSRGTERVGYETLQSEFVSQENYTRKWDDEASAPYLEAEGKFIGYDDPKSIRAKVEYLRETDLRGIMFWQYAHDENDHELTDAVHEALVDTA